MSKTNKTFTNIVGGEVSPFMYARLDLASYSKSMAKIENFMVLPQGGARYRAGTNFVNFTKGMQDGVFIPFQFNASQSYVIEATQGFFRFYANNGVITGNDALVTAMTNASPGVFTTSAAHGFYVGQQITLSGMSGTNIVNGTTFTIAAASFAATTFSLLTYPGGIAFNTTSIGTLTPNGYADGIWNIAGITVANPAVVTVTSHPYANGDEVFISGIVDNTGASGMGLNGKFFIVQNVTANTFTLTDLFANAIRTDLGGSYVSGGTTARIYQIATPYNLADLPYLQYAQVGDTMYIVNQNYAPRKLIRFGNANWTLNTFSRTGTDPFTGAGNWPAAVCFDGNGRLLYGGTATNPATVFGSSSPSSGAPNYDDFTLGTAATNAVEFTLGSLSSGKADSIQWIAATDQFSIIGTFATVRSFYGAAPGQSITPTAVSAQSIGRYGAAYTLPVNIGFSMFYIQRANQILRSIEYDIYIQNYNTTNRNLVAEHLTYNGLRQLALQQGVPDIIYATLGDGRYLSLTFQAKENISGWARHFLGGNYNDSTGQTHARGNIRWLQTMARAAATDQLWFIVQRQANGQILYCVEYQTDYPVYPVRHDFYTGIKSTDDTAFANAVFESQKYACHLDMAFAYVGTQPGISANATLTPGAISGNNVIFTASNPVFVQGMVQQYLYGAYDFFGNGGGRAQITGFLSSTQVICNIVTAFPSTTALTPGDWLVTAQQLTGLDYLNGETLSVICDGGPDVNQLVGSGQIFTTAPASVIFAGYSYTGTLETLNIDSGGETGSAESKVRNINHVAINFFNSLGTQYGSDAYHLDTVYGKTYSTSSTTTGTSKFDRPTVPFSGIKYLPYTDSWKRTDKRVTIIQSVPLPCTILSLDIFMMTSDDPN